MKYLLISCSKSKRRFFRPMPAKFVYDGTLFRLLLRYAAQERLKPLILSAKYGFISPDTLIEYYDQRLRRPYEGPWPEGTGFYGGGRFYFRNATKNGFESLVLWARSLSDWLEGVRNLCVDRKAPLLSLLELSSNSGRKR